MVARTLWYWGATNASPTDQFNQGPWSITPTLGRLISVQASGMLGQQSAVVGQPIVGVCDIIWGCQWGATGYTPFDILTSAYDDQWLWREMLYADDTKGVWAPNTDDAVFQVERLVKAKWRGQLQIGPTEVDLYVSFGSTFGASDLAYATYGDLEATWS